MCGEKLWLCWLLCWFRGSPPHVRGKGKLMTGTVPSVGITPACAGKSSKDSESYFKGQDHPRMCGEKTKKIP